MVASKENISELLIGDRNSIPRRAFLSTLGKAFGALAVANGAVYLIGSAFKELDGSLVAGAKCVVGTCLCNDLTTPSAGNSSVCGAKCSTHGGMLDYCTNGDEW